MNQKGHPNDKLGNRLKFYSEIRSSLSVFKWIDYSVISGGYVQNEEKLGDVDIITVLPYISGDLRKSAAKFARRHVHAQIRNGFSPDFQFPTDVVSRQQIRDAVSGRALEVANGRIGLKRYSEAEIANNPEADYRVWLFEMITHDFDLIGGSFERLVCDTIQAHKTIFLLVCEIHSRRREFQLEWLRQEMFSIAGLSYVMSEKQCRHMLMMIEMEQFGELSVKGRLKLNRERIIRESKKLKELIGRRVAYCGEHVVPWSKLRSCVKDFAI